jgi:6-pyruvoyltetrahydropterin/6-carboxytetrahydropterin synthase
MFKRTYHISKEKLEEYLKTYTVAQIAALENVCTDTIMARIKEYELKPLGASYFNKGCNNPAKREEVKAKISNTIKGLWDHGVYNDRINGMLYKFDWEHHNFNPANYYNDYARLYHIPLTCYYCGATEQERKIDIHHLDENHENWLLSNLLPVCNVCHTFFHYARYKGPSVTVGKIFRFEAAHHLLNYSGACENNHGHSYWMEVRLKGQINRDTGMVVDYKELKSTVQKYIIDVFDHSTINDVMDCNPTAENMLYFIWETLEKKGLVKGLQEIILKETDSSTASITKADMLQYYELNKELIVCKEHVPRLPKPETAKKVICKECGQPFWYLVGHIKNKHNMTWNEYVLKYPGELMEDPSMTKWKAENCMRRITNYKYDKSSEDT